jgi:hypothetical protein
MTGWAKAGNDVELWKFRTKALDYPFFKRRLSRIAKSSTPI